MSDNREATLRRELAEFLDDSRKKLESGDLLDAANALQRASVTCRMIDQVIRISAAESNSGAEAIAKQCHD